MPGRVYWSGWEVVAGTLRKAEHRISIGLVLISHPSYPRPCATHKSEFEGFACRSSWRNAGNSHFTLPIPQLDCQQQEPVIAVAPATPALGLGPLRVVSPSLDSGVPPSP